MDDITRQQPERTIKGGPRRPSTLVNRSELGAIAARERIVRILQGHDFDAVERSFRELGEADYPIVRLIAQEGVSSNLEPAIRYNAISVLGRGAPRENLNVLADLATFGEDFYVRGHALLALGMTGLYLALPVIALHLTARERFEQLAAARAIEALVKNSSEDGVKARLSTVEDPKLRSLVEEILGRMARGSPGNERKTPTEPRKRHE
jgi:HEAT repeat protein